MIKIFRVKQCSGPKGKPLLFVSQLAKSNSISHVGAARLQDRLFH